MFGLKSAYGVCIYRINTISFEAVAQNEKIQLASISWEGDSWKVLKSWPKATQWDFGNSLREMQHGRAARLAVRPMRSIGPGVFELKDSDQRAWYRMVYLARVAETIYVLDCFEKDTAKTERKDLNTARGRLVAVKQRMLEERKNEKRKPRQ
jgi:phage-related protein